VSIAGGLLLALSSSFALNWGWVAQHGAANRLPAASLRRPLASLGAFFSDTAWLIGFLVGLGGWAFYVGALALAPLSLVQASSAGGVGILAVLARARGAAIGKGHWAAVVVSVLGLVLLGASLAGGAAPTGAPGAMSVAGWLLVSAAIAALAALPLPVLAAGASLGIAAGVLYAAGDVATKAATLAGGWLVLVPLVLAAHGAAFVALQIGFQRGGALATAGPASLLTNALPIAAGLLVFHEHLPGGPTGALRLAAFGCVVVGGAALARAEPAPAAEPQGRAAEATGLPAYVSR
jgi:hypothetical protein